MLYRHRRLASVVKPLSACSDQVFFGVAQPLLIALRTVALAIPHLQQRRDVAPTLGRVGELFQLLAFGHFRFPPFFALITSVTYASPPGCSFSQSCIHSSAPARVSRHLSSCGLNFSLLPMRAIT